MTSLKSFSKAFAKFVSETQSETVDQVFTFLNEKLDVDAETLTDLASQFKELHKNDVVSLGGGDEKTAKKPKKTRVPSAYNLFIRDQMKLLKGGDPSLNGQELMKKATQAWSEHKTKSVVS